jgi:chorismate mutase
VKPARENGESRVAAEIAALRRSIDEVDRELIALLHRRARLAAMILARKRENGWPARDAVRERAILGKLRGRRNGFDAAALRRIFAAVLAASRRRAAT